MHFPKFFVEHPSVIIVILNVILNPENLNHFLIDESANHSNSTIKISNCGNTDWKLNIKHDCFSIFFCGCNQSQIFPRSGNKCSTLLSNKKALI